MPVSVKLPCARNFFSAVVLLPFAHKNIGVKKYVSQNAAFLVLVALLLPLFYVNVKDSHDWGDDFAQYFIQARNILEHRPQTDNGLVFDRQTGEYALQAYPVGFPLILAGAWFCFGDSIIVSSLVLSVFFFGFGIVCFFYFRKYFSQALSILLVLVIIYNPVILRFKKEVLSDVPFSFFLILGVLLFNSERKSKSHYLLTGIVWGFALSIRGIGASLFAASFIYILHVSVRMISKKGTQDEFFTAVKKVPVVSVYALAFYLLLNAILLPIPSAGILGFYADAMRGVDFSKWMVLNFEYYYHVFLNFFSTMGGRFLWLSTFTKYLMLVLIPAGIIVAWYRKPNFDDWLFIAYILVLFMYPYLGGGFRFLVPVLPFLMKYIFRAFLALMEWLKIKSAKPALIFLAVIILQYFPGIVDQVKSMDLQESGPQRRPAVETFDFIHHLPEDAVVVFLKPRALSFYSGRRAAYVTRSISQEDLPELFNRMHAHYFLVCDESDEVNDVLLKKFVEDHKTELKLIYQDSQFYLYSDLK